MLEELDRDIREHIERETIDNIERDNFFLLRTPDEARHAALRKFGNITRVKEETRGIWSLLWLEHLVEDIRIGFRLLRESPGFTAVAIATLANLLVARTVDREGELSMRAALGASRARLVRQLLTECLLLSVAAALAGLMVALWTASIATKVQPPPLGAQSYSVLDGRVLGFTALASIIAGLLFGVLPLLYAGRIYAFGTRSPGKSPAKTSGSRVIREALIAAQVMLTIILPAGSVSVGRAFESL